MSKQSIGACAVGAMSIVILAGCASGPTVRTNVDSGADFAQYKTFAFVSPLGTDRAGYQSIVSQQLVLDTERELQARGLTRNDSAPQLLVNFSAKLDQVLQVDAARAGPSFVGVSTYYGYRSYSTWPQYSQTTVKQYTQGTLNIDIVDAAHKQLVWEGIVTDSVTQKDMNDLPTAIHRAVVAAFAKFPIASPAR